MCRHQDIYPTLTITRDIVNLAIFGNEHMADHLKCIFCMFQHVVVVQCNKQCFYWIPHTRKYVCRHQYIYPTFTSTRDILNLVIFGSGQHRLNHSCMGTSVGPWTNSQTSASLIVSVEFKQLRHCVLRLLFRNQTTTRRRKYSVIR